MKALGWIESIVQDLRYGVRTLRRSPGFAEAAGMRCVLAIRPRLRWATTSGGMAGSASWKVQGGAGVVRCADGSHASTAKRFEWHAPAHLVAGRVAHPPPGGRRGRAAGAGYDAA